MTCLSIPFFPVISSLLPLCSNTFSLYPNPQDCLWLPEQSNYPGSQLIGLCFTLLLPPILYNLPRKITLKGAAQMSFLLGAFFHKANTGTYFLQIPIFASSLNLGLSFCHVTECAGGRCTPVLCRKVWELEPSPAFIDEDIFSSLFLGALEY